MIICCVITNMLLKGRRLLLGEFLLSVFYLVDITGGGFEVEMNEVQVKGQRYLGRFKGLRANEKD